MSHVVTAPLVLVKDQAGAVQYHYQGAVLPDYVADEDLTRLTEEGFITSWADEAPAAVDPAVVVIDPGASKKPAQVAPKEDWVAYAVAKGMTEAEANDLTKPQLIDKYKDS